MEMELRTFLDEFLKHACNLRSFFKVIVWSGLFHTAEFFNIHSDDGDEPVMTICCRSTAEDERCGDDFFVWFFNVACQLELMIRPCCCLLILNNAIIECEFGHVSPTIHLPFIDWAIWKVLDSCPWFNKLLRWFC